MNKCGQINGCTWGGDLILSIILTISTPFLWLFSMIHDNIMFKFLNSSYIYNVSWEDPRMDQRVFNLGSDDHVITIASAGCNVLDYIIEGAEVTAVDFNSCQIALTDIKKAAILSISYEDFFDIFGSSNIDKLKELYPTTIRPLLNSKSAIFWDSYINSIQSFMYSGTSGTLAYVLFRILFPLMGLGFIRKDLISGTRHDKLKTKLLEYKYTFQMLAWICDNIFFRVGSCMAGVPVRQMELGSHRQNVLQIVNNVLFGTDIVNDNYFFAGYILGYYQKDNCPRYLREEHYETMREMLKQDKLHLIHGTLIDAIKTVKNPITIASLLDHLDWMTDRDINEELAELSKKMSTEKALIYWRTFADDVHSAPLVWLNPRRVDDKDDRVCMYWHTWIADFTKCKNSYENRVTTNHETSLVNNLVTGLKMITYPLWKPLVKMINSGDTNDVELFYKYQKDGYDTFREDFLHARSVLMDSIPLTKGGNMVWIDVGGGTARNLEYFTPETIRKYFSKIVIVDISQSLLDIASDRIKLMGLEDIVTVLLHDISGEDVECVSLPNTGTVDLITLSYSYSMIGNKKTTLKNINMLLKEGGTIAIADFLSHGKHDSSLPSTAKFARSMESAFQSTWFSMDGVYLLTDQNILDVSSSYTSCIDVRFRGAVPYISWFLPLTPYHGVCIWKKKTNNTKLYNGISQKVDNGIDKEEIREVVKREIQEVFEEGVFEEEVIVQEDFEE
jgi:S-adenosylmethionine:diacylglycerol 3-amino-3-carboxypropyl transferase/ubiquinone/menaquinone biosynthesis C-methylase UbiE